jgi:hypothetical protein
MLNLGINKSPYMVVPPVKKSLLQTKNVSLFVLRQLKPLRFSVLPNFVHEYILETGDGGVFKVEFDVDGT